MSSCCVQLRPWRTSEGTAARELEVATARPLTVATAGTTATATATATSNWHSLWHTCTARAPRGVKNRPAGGSVQLVRSDADEV